VVAAASSGHNTDLTRKAASDTAERTGYATKYAPRRPGDNPAGIVFADARRGGSAPGYPGLVEDPADDRSADPAAQFARLALRPTIIPERRSAPSPQVMGLHQF